MPNSGRVVVLLAGSILGYQLLLPPVVGLADNGDFVKVIGRFGLWARVHRTYEFIDTVYQFQPEKRWTSPFYSLEIPLVHPALWLNRIISKDGSFDIRCIGIVHSALFLAAVWLFAPLLGDARRGVRWAMYGLVLFTYCDMMYVSSLNSFYMDEPAYLFLLLSAVMYLRVLRWGRRVDAVLLMLCPFLLVSAKGQHALIGFWMALLFLTAAKALRPIRPSRWYATAGGLVLASILMMWKAQPADYTINALYNIVFEEILPHAPSVERTMADLGLDDSFRFCIGKKSYLPDSGIEDPAFRQRFLQRLSFGKLAMFYVRRPAITYQTMRDGLSEAGRQHLFGTFDMSAGYAPLTESRAFALWSDVKRHYFGRQGRRFLITFVALTALLCGLLALQRKRLPQGSVPAGLCLIGTAWTEMCIATLCDSMDIIRHCLIFFALFDMIALVCVYLLVPAMLKGALSRSL